MRSNFIILAVFVTNLCYAQSIFRKWKTIDDETQKARSIVEIGVENGTIYGKIIKGFLRPGEKPGGVCDKCNKNDPRYNKKILGMNILEDIQKKEGTKYWVGKILDPKKGKIYSCKIWVENGNLRVRGYWAFFYRTQTWLPYTDDIE